MKPEEVSVIGVVFLMFGTSWLAYAYVQPLDQHVGVVCTTGPGPVLLPPCTSLSIAAELFYVLGLTGVVISIAFLVVRMRMRKEPSESAS
jgi:hypothetical protein